MKYLYNLTIHCDPAIFNPVKEHILSSIIPQWQLFSPRPEAVHLLKGAEGQILAIQEVISDEVRIQNHWSPMELSSVQMLTRMYPERVVPFDTVLEFIG